ncbi:ATP-dependent helicase [Acetivibrio straminisolvens]|jgi:DNA helicase-2/ATP-dependent DNA helicase PcrA|uniref:DNA 3'-5' helicase n=1 Tax=Acetivibrio straminisolvens JCM 21531 TaxID=1294263 RepID=W4V479_9FIRM|nr:ATP-dependent helicase [Acetivibrio straminisolvens]GAE87549.1 ATP-dependent DNA helicase YjcD [Acetivibrio straminisolvens JCM 21531]
MSEFMNREDFFRLLADKYNLNLNPQQKEAVLRVHGPSLLLSVPGGGKTTVIVSRCANMILNHKIDPGKILTLTFSKASAQDMKTRFCGIFGKELASSMIFSTIHSFCYSVARLYTRSKNKPMPQIIEGNESPINKNQILKQIYLDINNEYISDDRLEDLSNSISFVKNMLYTEENIRELDVGIKNFVDIYNAYEKRKKNEGFIDYDDMLTGTYRLLKKNTEIINMLREKYHYINVDESQDTSLVQHEIIKLVARPKNNIFMVGDEDQSIYGFRAAFPQALLDFGKTYPGAKILLMEKNYRSTKSIVVPANIFIKQNKGRYQKDMYTENEEGEAVVFKHVESRNEQYVYLTSALKSQSNLAQCAVLYRNNISAIPLVDYLEYNNIPFYIRDTNLHFFRHWVVNDILAFIRLALDPFDVEAFGQIYYKTNAFISREMYEYVVENMGKGKGAIETLLNYPNIPKDTFEAIKYLAGQIETIDYFKPLKAVEFIEKECEYEKYIRRASKEMGYSVESLNYIIDSLKSIASRVDSFEGLFERLSILKTAVENSIKNRNKNAVVLTTIHSSKGLEFDRVYMIDLVDGQFPSSKSISDCKEGNYELMEEEVRLFYVGVTRARKYLELLTFSKANNKPVAVSRFVHRFNLAQKQAEHKAVSNEICEGAVLEHVVFGQGLVTRLDESKDLIVIEFESVGTKMLSLKTCIEGKKIQTSTIS